MYQLRIAYRNILLYLLVTKRLLSLPLRATVQRAHLVENHSKGENVSGPGPLHSIIVLLGWLVPAPILSNFGLAKLGEHQWRTPKRPDLHSHVLR